MKISLSVAISALVFLGALGVYGFLFVKTGTFVSAAVADRASAAAAGQEESVQKTIQTFVSNTTSEQTELASYVANDASVVSVIQTIEDAATREGVTATIGTIAIVPKDWRYHEILEVSLSAIGSFAALTAFSTDLESLPQASRLARTSFQASAGKEWFVSYTLDFLKEISKTQTP